ncbi:Growth-regulating factor [Heracleum sosnowskyi]|uniref:Growth-regulating factor n=1 Tax=Heracleum sosnowskyi TaxID=360622 RepID=A0AAD8MK85_9APIA|nr:Growth-regulating factor [Heracleum sosnowskyi]
MMGSAQNRYLFTASQLEEFKHQALIYNYMVSGVPVPTDLLSALKRKLDFSSTLFLHKQVRWGSYRKRFNRKEELEPERCKRTDGKKWRCSREAHRESRYCERHMHRGRKPVTISANTTSPVIKIHSNSVHDHPSIQTSALIHPASLYSQSSSRQNSSTQQLFLESGSFYQTNKDYRFMQGMRDGERAFFPMDSKTVRRQHISHKTSKISSSDYFHTINDHGKFEDQRRQEEGRELKQHSFIIGNDFKPARSINVDTDEKNQDNFHHFFGEWPLKGKAPWLDNREKHSDHASASLSNTQLSTSTSLSTLELFQPNPTVQWF